MAKLHEKMFVAQSTLEAWLESGKIDFTGSVITLKTHSTAYALEPAVRIESIIAGALKSNLMGKVLTQKRITEVGGELLEDSVVFGEIAFQVSQGYVATLMRPGEPVESTGPISPGRAGLSG